ELLEINTSRSLNAVSSAAPGKTAPFSADKSGDKAELLVTKIHPDVTEEELLEKFSTVGPVLSVKISRDPGGGDVSAYVLFKQIADAERALDTLYWDDMKGELICIQWSPNSAKGIIKNLRRLQIWNLDENIDDNALRQHFEKFGPIVKAQVKCGEGQKFAFVLFENPTDADKAADEMHGKTVGSKDLRIYQKWC
uniref:RRM domain-containing protein n=1 Tax=Steinernema glaseri TaxID=37863 RepID=A0A1I7Z057_9BILA